jgi:hypothetical protein
MKAKWEDAWELADFYRYWKKRLELRGYWMMFGYGVCFVRVVQPKERL